MATEIIISSGGTAVTEILMGSPGAVESVIRDAADAVLQTNIDAEAATRLADDTTLQTNIDAEASTRATADTTLQTNIDAEAATRLADDTTLQTNIDAEAATRLADDTTLQTNINAEAAARIAADDLLTPLAQKGVLNGVATLDADVLIPDVQIPNIAIAKTTGLQAALDLKAPLASPALSGSPTAPTPLLADNNTSIATTAFVKAQNYLVGNQTITFTGDATGSGTTAVALTMATSGVSAGTFNKLTVNAKGLVTAASSETTLAGLGIVDADTTVQSDAKLALKIDLSEKGALNGVATLNGSGLIPDNQLPALAITNTSVVASEVAMLALNAQTGDVAIRTDTNQTFILNGTATILTDWNEVLNPIDGVTNVTAGTGLTGGAITSTGTIGVDFTGGGTATTVARSDRPHTEINGLQTALDGKLSVGAKAADSDLLDGVDGAGYVNVAGAQTIAGIKNFTDNIGINKAAPEARLHIGAGDFLLDNGQFIRFKDSAGTSRDAMVWTGSDMIRFNNHVGGYEFMTASVLRMSISIGGQVALGMAVSGGSNRLQISGPQIGEGDSVGQIYVRSTAAYNANPEAGIIFVNEHTPGSQGIMGGIRVGKENATNGDLSSFLALDTRRQGGVAVERLRIDSNGNIEIGGTVFAGNIVRWITKSSAYVAVAGDGIFADTTTAAFTITLPTAVLGQVIEVKDNGNNFATNNLTVGTFVLNVNGEYAKFVHDGTAWVRL